MAMIESDLELYIGFQGPNENCDDYMAVFKVRLDTISVHRHLDGRYPRHLTDSCSRIQEEQEITNTEIKDMQSSERIALHKEMADSVHGGYIACLFLKKADESWFGKLKTILVNGHLNLNASDSHYPKTLQEAALYLLNEYTTIVSSRQHNSNNDNSNKEGVAFMEHDISSLNCFGCDNNGHLLEDCKKCWMQRRKRCE